jgi:hypothetical protein
MNPTIPQRTHLTAEQFDLLLHAEKPGPAEDAHLAACPTCRQQLDRLRAALCDLRTAVTAYSSAQRNPAPFSVRLAAIEAIPASRPVWRTRMAFAGSFAAVVLAAAVSTLVPHGEFNNRPQPVAVDTISSTAEANKFPIESDEALLDGIDQDLTDAVPPSLQPLAVASPSNSALHQQ